MKSYCPNPMAYGQRKHYLIPTPQRKEQRRRVMAIDSPLIRRMKRPIPSQKEESPSKASDSDLSPIGESLSESLAAQGVYLTPEELKRISLTT